MRRAENTSSITGILRKHARARISATAEHMHTCSISSVKLLWDREGAGLTDFNSYSLTATMPRPGRGKLGVGVREGGGRAGEEGGTSFGPSD